VISNIKSKETDLLSARNSDKTKNTYDSNTSSFLSLIVAFAMCCIASVIIIWFFNRSEKYRAELEDKLQKLTTLNNEIKQLALVSAHNLQEPMRKMQMIVDWLQHAKGVEDPNLNEQLNRIKDIYGRQQLTNNKIIDYYDILLSRYSMENISLGSFIAKLRIKYNWDLLFKLSIEPLKEVYADPGQLELLFLHLVHNAQQFRHPERLLEIRMHEVAANQQPVIPAGIANREYYCVAVSDNGIGLQGQYLDKIFDLFQKVEVSQENISQSGMGLSFCKRIMLNHGGWIAAGKNDPDGLRILLFFPAI
jgi:light-regulated signal transduction histidine kinase (bacteriophytochrome)